MKNCIVPTIKKLSAVPDSEEKEHNNLISKVVKDKNFLQNIQKKFDELDILLL